MRGSESASARPRWRSRVAGSRSRMRNASRRTLASSCLLKAAASNPSGRAGRSPRIVNMFRCTYQRGSSRRATAIGPTAGPRPTSRSSRVRRAWLDSDAHRTSSIGAAPTNPTLPSKASRPCTSIFDAPATRATIRTVTSDPSRSSACVTFGAWASSSRSTNHRASPASSSSSTARVTGSPIVSTSSAISTTRFGSARKRWSGATANSGPCSDIDSNALRYASGFGSRSAQPRTSSEIWSRMAPSASMRRRTLVPRAWRCSFCSMRNIEWETVCPRSSSAAARTSSSTASGSMPWFAVSRNSRRCMPSPPIWSRRFRVFLSRAPISCAIRFLSSIASRPPAARNSSAICSR